MSKKYHSKILILTTIFFAYFISSCKSPKVPLQPNNGIVKNYSESSVLKILKSNDLSSVNYYNDSTIYITNVPFFQQGNDNTCGQAILAIMLNFWGINISYQSIVNESNPGNFATDIDRITSYLRKKGLYAQDYRKASLNFIKDRVQKGNPVVVLLDFGKLSTEHYVVVIGYNEEKKEIIIHDPVDGPNMKLNYDNFLIMWENKSLKKLGIFGDKYNQIAFDTRITDE